MFLSAKTAVNKVLSELFVSTITEKSAVAFSLGSDNLKRYFDQR